MVSFWKKRSRKKVIASLRRELLFWGLDCSHLTDAEFEKLMTDVMMEMGEIFKRSSFTATEAHGALKVLADCEHPG